jgi:hypothetical protein
VFGQKPSLAKIRRILRGMLLEKTESTTMGYIKYPEGIKSANPARADR